jgi:hypothetical protein
MGKAILSAIVMLAFPAVVFLGGARAMIGISHREKVPERPLNQRFFYNACDAQNYWAKFSDRGRAEQRFLELDLVFPFLYGGALAISLLWVWASLGRPFHPAWLIAPLAITALADWTENLVQLGQIKRFLAGTPVQEGWILVASAVTALKLVFFYASWLGLLALVLLLIFRARQ